MRLAQKQIQALFHRREVDCFPAPGLDRRDSFFARQVSERAEDERLYLGVAAQGRGPSRSSTRGASIPERARRSSPMIPDISSAR